MSWKKHRIKINHNKHTKGTVKSSEIALTTKPGCLRAEKLLLEKTRGWVTGKRIQ